MTSLLPHPKIRRLHIKIGLQVSKCKPEQNRTEHPRTLFQDKAVIILFSDCLRIQIKTKTQIKLKVLSVKKPVENIQMALGSLPLARYALTAHTHTHRLAAKIPTNYHKNKLTSYRMRVKGPIE